jgi:hypothetical protein
MRALNKNSQQQQYYCSYCEQYIGNNGVKEHYRPKSIYPWLADNPDNILISCQKCNNHKKDKFAIGKPIYEGNKTDMNPEQLDEIEAPLLINPKNKTQDFFTKYLIFNLDATIHSDDLRLHYTIGCCKLNDKSLIDLRIKALNKLFNEELLKIKTSFKKHKDVNRCENDRKKLLSSILRQIKNSSIEFSAMFRYIVNHRDLLFDKLKC